MVQAYFSANKVIFCSIKINSYGNKFPAISVSAIVVKIVFLFPQNKITCSKTILKEFEN